jgi:transcriptional regulator with PAS, ATPase and Fis domain
LDEIGEISPSAQIKLLRVIQTQKFERLGSEQTVSVHVRILAATNKDLLQEVKNGNFREDLYYRINVIPIQLPPLRSRKNDIPLLVQHFQQKFVAEHGGTVKGLSSEAMRRLLDYHWPGNVRELENSIEHAVVLSKDKDGLIEGIHMPSGIISDMPRPSTRNASRSQTIIDNEKKLLKNVLEECNWNKSQAATRLGISRSTLYGKLKKYQLTEPPAQ